MGELYLGVAFLPDGRRKDELRRHADSVRRAYRQRTIPLTVEIAQNYASSVAEMRTSGRSISVNDAYIAAASTTTGAKLCTLNVRHFEHYPGLEVISPLS